MNEIYAPHRSPEVDTVRKALGALITSAYTLLIVPPHEATYRKVELHDGLKPLPLQPPIEVVTSEVEKLLYERTRIFPNRLTGRQLLRAAGVLMQFTHHVPSQEKAALTNFESIFKLHHEVCSRAKKSDPLTFDQQLEIALEQSVGQPSLALWNLFLASRQFARWQDQGALFGIPHYTEQEKLQLMVEWQNSLAACKPAGEEHQDAAGDTYYCWTHALAAYTFGALPERSNYLNKVAGHIFRQGTKIMQPLVNTFAGKDAQIVSDHTTASIYGNAIGDVFLSVNQRQMEHGLNLRPSASNLLL